MKRVIIQTRNFSKEIKSLVGKKKLLEKDFEDLKRALIENPLAGDLIPGTGGIRKIRIKSFSKGKSGGFRICYYYYLADEEIFLILIYQKNEQENISNDEKKMLKELTAQIKGK